MEGEKQNWFTQNYDIWKDYPHSDTQILSGYAFYQLSYLPNIIEERISLSTLYSKEKIIRINNSILYIYLYNNEAYVPLSGLGFGKKQVGKISIVDNKVQYKILYEDTLNSYNFRVFAKNCIYEKRIQKESTDLLDEDNEKYSNKEATIVNLGNGKFIII